MERWNYEIPTIPIFHYSTSEFLMEVQMELVRVKTNRQGYFWLIAGWLFVAMVLLAYSLSYAAAAKQKSFSSAEEAVKSAIAAARSNNDKELLAIFGADAKEILFSGDPVADKQRRAQFLAAYDQKNRLATDRDRTILNIGNQDWPFPIPVVKQGDRWIFDTAQGREEILNRRIGENELNTIQSMLAVVDAQREYAMKDRDRNALLEYAQKFVSDPGKRNGLYWEAKAGEPQSPLGPIMLRLRAEGYQAKAPNTPVPYQGYYFRILTAQGRNAPGGAYSYMVKGKMIGGFAVVAHPAEYGNSGVMTFIVNHDGKVFQKDLGKNTATLARNMKEYNPDKTWTEVKE
jgi:type II secretory pathway pseudopilin PulG